MEASLSVLLAVGLSAACGFRVFVPLLVVSLAMKTGHLTLAPGFEWIGSWPALLAFGIATLLEIAAYFIPWLDNLLDTIATPAAIVAGIVVASSVIQDMDPFLKWTLAVIAGGGAAGMVQGWTTVTRAASTLTTGGAGNPIFSALETGGSILLSFLAILIPVAAGIVVLGILIMTARIFRRRAPSSIGR
ncbi:MAG TPA: DUF4126 domain-containing protein [Thermoanaerobaculia bacterium]|nr:DUF4126 domain-containing protein [Thermoanaerobaculia bacterium]HUM29986.1 DUF4126 domain-containing protein [Thermoanaerobaculia bacterium]HXK68325.1 DUF4126 domain-containing protein [Thermoanaerobaculia bacterium]